MEKETTLDSKNPSRGQVQDSAGVLIFPPALLFGTLLLGLLLSIVRPWSLPLGFTSAALTRAVAGLLALAGAVLIIWGRTTMVRADTNVPPNKPTVTIVTEGPFRFTRNPLYVGGTLIYLAIAVALRSAWLLWLFAPMMIVLWWGIIRREERYLESKFGTVYLAYKGRVRRWL